MGLWVLSVYPPAFMRTNKNKANFQLNNKIILKAKGVHILDTVTVSEDNNGAAYFSSHIKIELLLESY
ncbi:hypothetical protein AB1282_03210 [Gottfriedia sp. S16(2024)]|uniref:hypothetical protein n=1 Tax=Gottfriedia sp. S16(2024) TaxID=3162883 RepID=UPI003D1AF464